MSINMVRRDFQITSVFGMHEGAVRFAVHRSVDPRMLVVAVNEGDARQWYYWKSESAAFFPTNPSWIPIEKDHLTVVADLSYNRHKIEWTKPPEGANAFTLYAFETKEVMALHVLLRRTKDTEPTPTFESPDDALNRILLSNRGHHGPYVPKGITTRHPDKGEPNV